jgi:hypothetical protein
VSAPSSVTTRICGVAASSAVASSAASPPSLPSSPSLHAPVAAATTTQAATSGPQPVGVMPRLCYTGIDSVAAYPRSTLPVIVAICLS